MKYFISLLLTTCILFNHVSSLEVTSDITVTTNWTPADNPVIIRNNIILSFGSTLTIQPGTEVQLDNDVQLTISGTINADGIQGLPVVFDKVPGTLGHRGILFTSFATSATYDSSNNYVSGSTFRWVTFQGGYEWNDVAYLHLDGHMPYISDCTFSSPTIRNQDGIYVTGLLESYSKIERCDFTAIDVGIWSTDWGSPAGGPYLEVLDSRFHSLRYGARSSSNTLDATIVYSGCSFESTQAGFWFSVRSTIVIDNCEFLDSYDAAFVDYTITNITNSYFSDITRYGIKHYETGSATNVHIYNNTFVDIDTQAVHLHQWIYAGTSYYIASNNFTHNGVSTANDEYTLYVATGESGNVIIEDNLFQDNTCQRFCVILSTDWDDAKNSVFRRNTFISNVSEEELIQYRGRRSYSTTRVYGHQFYDNVMINNQGLRTLRLWDQQQLILQNNTFNNPDVDYELFAYTEDNAVTTEYLANYGKGIIDARFNYWRGLDSRSAIRALIRDGSTDLAFPYYDISPWRDGGNQISSVSEIPFLDTSSSPSIIAGIVPTSMSLTAANSPYRVLESIWIPQGVELDIQAGVELRFSEGQGIYVAGLLLTNGTSASPVRLIKDPDDTSPNNWAGIVYSVHAPIASWDGNGDYTGGSLLRGTDIIHAGYHPTNIDDGAIHMDIISPKLEAVRVLHSNRYGITADELSYSTHWTDVEVYNSTITCVYGKFDTITTWRNVEIHGCELNGYHKWDGWTSDQFFYDVSIHDVGNTGYYCAWCGDMYFYNSQFYNIGFNSQGAEYDGHAIGFETTLRTIHFFDTSFTNIYDRAFYSLVYSSWDVPFGFYRCSFQDLGAIARIFQASATNHRYYVDIMDSTFSGSLAGPFSFDWTSSRNVDTPINILNNVIDSAVVDNSVFEIGCDTGNCQLITTHGPFHMINNTFTNNSGSGSLVRWYKGASTRDHIFLNNTLFDNTMSAGVTEFQGNLPLVKHNFFQNAGSASDLVSISTNAAYSIDARENWWNATDEFFIKQRILDFFDDSSRSVVDYFPWLTAPDVTQIADENTPRESVIKPGNEVYGQVLQDETLLSGVSYTVSGDVQVSAGYTLTIEPGAILCFEPGRSIRVGGGIQAVGTEAQPIIMTSCQTGSDPLTYYWGGISFTAESVGTNFTSNDPYTMSYLEGNRLEWVTMSNVGFTGSSVGPALEISQTTIHLSHVDVLSNVGQCLAVTSSPYFLWENSQCVESQAGNAIDFATSQIAADLTFATLRDVVFNNASSGGLFIVSNPSAEPSETWIRLIRVEAYNVGGALLSTEDGKGGILIDGCRFENVAGEQNIRGDADWDAAIFTRNWQYTWFKNITIQNSHFESITPEVDILHIVAWYQRVYTTQILIHNNTYINTGEMVQFLDRWSLTTPGGYSFIITDNTMDTTDPAYHERRVAWFYYTCGDVFYFERNVIRNRVFNAASMTELRFDQASVCNHDMFVRNNTFINCVGDSAFFLYLHTDNDLDVTRYIMDFEYNTFINNDWDYGDYDFYRVPALRYDLMSFKYNIHDNISPSWAIQVRDGDRDRDLRTIDARFSYWGSIDATMFPIYDCLDSTYRQSCVQTAPFLASYDYEDIVNLSNSTRPFIDYTTMTLAGVLETDTVLTIPAFSGLFTITENLFIPPGSSLIIHEGNAFQMGQYRRILVGGGLQVLGTAQDPVVFNSTTPNVPNYLRWGDIVFSTTSDRSNFDASYNYINGSIFSHVELNSGGNAVYSTILSYRWFPYVEYLTSIGSGDDVFYADFISFGTPYVLRNVYIDDCDQVVARCRNCRDVIIRWSDFEIVNTNAGATGNFYENVDNNGAYSDIQIINWSHIGGLSYGIYFTDLIGSLLMDNVHIEGVSQTANEWPLFMRSRAWQQFDGVYRNLNITQNFETAYFESWYARTFLDTWVIEDSYFEDNTNGIRMRCNSCTTGGSNSITLERNEFVRIGPNSPTFWIVDPPIGANPSCTIFNNRFIDNDGTFSTTDEKPVLLLNLASTAGIGCKVTNNFFERNKNEKATVWFNVVDNPSSSSFSGNSLTGNQQNPDVNGKSTTISFNGCNVVLDSNILINPLNDYEFEVEQSCVGNPIVGTNNWWGTNNATNIIPRITAPTEPVSDHILYEPFLLAPEFDCAGVNDCSGNGDCGLKDFCYCYSGYGGDDCSQEVCVDVFDCNTGNGGGTCVGANTCSCNTGWLPPYCTQPTCTNVNNCSGQGSCISVDTCLCAINWDGPSCDTCAPNYFGPSCQECPACDRGECNTSTGLCDCEIEWAGALCDECAPRYYGPTCDNMTVVLNVIPNAGYDVGGEIITIIGDWFEVGAECRFGSVTVPSVWISDTEIKCEAPSQAAGTYSIEVTSNRGGFTSGSGVDYSYVGLCGPSDCNNNGQCAFLACVCDLGWTDPSCSTAVLAPVINQPADSSLVEGDSYNTTLSLSVVTNAETLTWLLVDGPSGLTVNPSTGFVNWPSVVGSPSAQVITVRATNEIGSSEVSWNLNIPLSFDCSVSAASASGTGQGSTVFIGLQRSGTTATVDCQLWIELRGTYRTFIVENVGASGAVYAFQPSINEAGLYSVGARHPEDTVYGAPNDSFELWGISLSSYTIFRTVSSGYVEIENVITVTNLGENIIPDLSQATPSYSLPIGNLIDLGLADMSGEGPLAGFASRDITIFTNATDSQTFTGPPFQLTVYSPSTGASRTFSLYLTVKAPAAEFRFETPNPIYDQIIIRGFLSTFDVTFTNIGTSPSGTINVQLPSAATPEEDIFSISANAQSPSLAIGESRTFTLNVNPGLSLGLGTIPGSIRVSDGDSFKDISFRFRVTSDIVAQLVVVVEDEYTYFAEGSPNLDNTTVTVENLVTRERITVGPPNFGSGIIFDDLVEGTYNIKVQSLGHSPYSADVVLTPGANTHYAFLSRTAVSYTWTVEPTEIEDTYTFTLEADFTTNVPLPVIIIEPTTIDIEELEKLSCGEETFFSWTITNYGLVAANDPEIGYPEHSFLVFEQLINPIGDLAANSTTIVPVRVSRPASNCTVGYCVHGTCACDEECDCDVGWYGPRCDERRCNNGEGCGQGDCNVNTVTCDCDAGYTGSKCDQPDTPAPTSCPPGCAYNGVCNAGTSYTWQCSAGYGGRGCCTPICPGSFFPQRGLCLTGGVVGCRSGWGNAPYCNYRTAGICANGRFDYYLICRGLQRYSRIITYSRTGPCSINNPITTAVTVYGYGIGVWYWPPPVVYIDRCAAGCISFYNRCVRYRYYPFGCARVAFNGWTRATSVRVLLTSSIRSSFCSVSSNGLRGYWIGRRCLRGLSAPCGFYSRWIGYYSGHRRLLGATGVQGGTPEGDAANRLISVSDSVEALGAITYSMFGSDEDAWLEVNDAGWGDLLVTITADNSENEVFISPNERLTLLSNPPNIGESNPPEYVEAEIIDRYISRWNRTFEYLNAGIVAESEVPVGDSTDFVSADLLNAALSDLFDLNDAAILGGYTDFEEEFLQAYDEYTTAYDEIPAGVCATVTIRIEQELVLRRNAFEATLEILNEGTDILSDIYVEIDIRDEDDFDANDKFTIVTPELSGGLTGVDGNGGLGANSQGEAVWIIIPERDAVPGANPVYYFVGGSLNYKLNGFNVSTPLFPDSIQVYPDPELVVDYFWQREVYSDDPFTADVVEPAIPFTLGLLISNEGYGGAKDVHMTTGQPEIIENEKGLLVDFEIISTQVGFNVIEPTLRASFGDINPLSSAVARWQMICSLQGYFSNFNVTFEHTSDFGNPELSLIRRVDIHSLTQAVRISEPYPEGKNSSSSLLLSEESIIDDELPDFLADDISDLENIPDTLWSSRRGEKFTVSHLPTVMISTTPIAGEIEYYATLTVDLSGHTSEELEGWVYIRADYGTAPEIRAADTVISAVTGPINNNKTLNVRDDNVWKTFKRQNLQSGTVDEKYLHILDHNVTTGVYSLLLTPLGPPTGLRITEITENSISIAWNSVALAYRYRVAWRYVGKPEDTDYHIVSSNVLLTEYRIGGLWPDGVDGIYPGVTYEIIVYSGAAEFEINGASVIGTTNGTEPDICEPLCCTGDCENGIFGLCSCDSGWTGEACCTPVCGDGCQGGGICIAPDECQCPPGTVGPTCEEESIIDPILIATSTGAASFCCFFIVCYYRRKSVKGKDGKGKGKSKRVDNDSDSDSLTEKKKSKKRSSTRRGSKSSTSKESDVEAGTTPLNTNIRASVSSMSDVQSAAVDNVIANISPTPSRSTRKKKKTTTN